MTVANVWQNPKCWQESYCKSWLLALLWIASQNLPINFHLGKKMSMSMDKYMWYGIVKAMEYFKMLKRMKMFRLKRAAPNSTPPSSQAEDVLLSAYVWMRATCWAPATASSWERRQEQFECCGESCLQKHCLEKKKTVTSQLQVPLMLNQVRVYQLYQIYQLFEQNRQTCYEPETNCFFCTASHRSGKDFQSFASTSQWSENKQISQVACTHWPCSPGSFY